jgi:alkaline phosphatase
MRIRYAAVVIAGTLVLIVMGCPGFPTLPTALNAPQSIGLLVGAGDIGDCAQEGATVTAAILDATPGTVFTAGDNAYPVGSLADYRRCYEPTWGRHRGRTRPVSGNHEYETAGASGYFDYFGEAAGPRGLGYYSYGVGPWLVLALNSNIDAGPTSAQYRWLQTTLQSASSRCTAAIWHHPVRSSGPNGGSPGMLAVWKLLAESGVDLVINGHEHLYERFATLDAQGEPAASGMRLFVVGTGGAGLRRVVRVQPGSLVQISEWGVLILTLRPDAYAWRFVTSAEATAASDEGHDVCR